jgi:hypothetical protein
MYLVNKEKINRWLSAKIVDARVAKIFDSFKDILVTWRAWVAADGGIINQKPSVPCMGRYKV